MKYTQLNKYLSRLLVLLFFLLLGGLLQVLATDITGFTTVTITGNMNVTGVLHYNGSEGDVPHGAIILFNSSCPSGWNEVSAYNARYPRGNTSFGVTGDSAHTHTSTHTHTETLSLAAASHQHQWAYAYGSTTTSSDGSHSHTMTSCGSTWKTATIGSAVPDVYSAASAGTDTEPDHYHDMDWQDYDSGGGSHSHTISGSIGTSADSSSSASITPEYYDLVLCMKW